jgi:arylsulfatase A-like enzyme
MKNILMKLTLLILIGLCPLGLVYSFEQTSPKPNFIIFYVDDLGWADTAVKMMDMDDQSRHRFYQTPNLQALSEDGMVFSNAYSPAPTCTPSRLSIQLGKTPARLRCTIVNDVMAFKEDLTWQDQTSIADVLVDSGHNYVTAHFGKGMGKDRMTQIGYQFTDEYDIGPNGNYHGDYIDIPSGQPNPASDPKRINSLIDASIEFLENNTKENPFLMMLSHYAVHVPFAADESLIKKYTEKYNVGYFSNSGSFMAEDQIENHRSIDTKRIMYAAMLDHLDFHLGQIIAKLKELNVYENTYIIFTSDNGGGLDGNGSLRGGKASLFEGGIRVPLVISGPRIKGGTQCDVPVSQWDFLPTIHELAQCPQDLPEGLDGGSMHNLLKFGNGGIIQRPVEGLVFHYPSYFNAPVSVLRLGKYKYMKHLNTGDIKLFNLDEDYQEKNNISQSNKNVVQKLDKILQNYLNSVNAYDMDDVYNARLLQLNDFEKRHLNGFEKFLKSEKSASKEDAENAKRKLFEALERIQFGREQVAKNRYSGTWSGGNR